MTGLDEDLRARFARLREEERGRVPGFGAVRVRAPRVRARSTVRVPAIAAAAAVALIAYGGVRLLDPPGPAALPPEVVVAPVQVVLVGARWTSPTDFLLDIPGASLLRTVPTFDRAMHPFAPLSPAPPRDSGRLERGA